MKQKREIRIIWSIEDVQSIEPALTDEQAWSILEEIGHDHDASIGINWDTIREAVERYTDNNEISGEPLLYEYVNAEDCFENDNAGLTFGIHWKDTNGNDVAAEWFRTAVIRQDCIMKAGKKAKMLPMEWGQYDDNRRY